MSGQNNCSVDCISTDMLTGAPAVFGTTLVLGKDGKFHRLPSVPSVAVLDEGVSVHAAPTALNFVGAGVTATTIGTIATVTIPSSQAVAVQNEGTTVQAAPTALNFVGAGVTASTLGTVATVTIPAGATPVQNEGLTVSSTPTAINFVGAGVTASTDGPVATITVPSFTVKEAGLEVYGLPAAPAFLNFFGAYVSPNGAGIIVDIPGVNAYSNGVLTDTRVGGFNFTGNATASAVGGGVSTVNVPFTPILKVGSVIAQEPTAINFVGAGVDVTNVAGVATVTVSGSNIEIRDNNSFISAAPTFINFIGGALNTDGPGIDVVLPTINIYEDGIPRKVTAQTINFTGNTSVTVGPDPRVTNVTVPFTPVQNAGLTISSAPTAINFNGVGFSVTDVAGVATIGLVNIMTVLDDGILIGGTPNGINFVGPGIAVTNVAGIATVGLTDINGPAYIASALPPASVMYRRAFVSDAAAPAFGAVVTGGGTTLTPVYSDGANWRVG